MTKTKMARPTRTELRVFFDLGRKRWRTIARDPRFAALLTTSDPVSEAPELLQTLYALRNNETQLRVFRRDRQKELRAARAERRMVKIPESTLLDTGTQRNVVIKRIYATGIASTDEQYQLMLRKCTQNFYALLPLQWRKEGIDVYLFYGFYGSKLAPPGLKHIPLKAKTDGVQDSVYEGGLFEDRFSPLHYCGHKMTSLDEGYDDDSLKESVRSLPELETLVMQHITIPQ